NDCPKPSRDPAEVGDRGNVDPGRVEEAVKAAIIAAAGGDEALAGKILDKLFGGGRRPSPGELAAAFRALTPGKDGRPDPAAVEAFLRGGDFPVLEPSLGRWGAWVEEHRARERCDSIDLVGLANAVAGAIDPTVARPPAAQRVLATLPGFTHIGPV